MYYVYCLKSKTDDKLYIGSTNDLRRRLLEHNDGKVRATKSRVPFELRYYEAFHAEDEARQREASLKDDGRALAQLKRRITKSLRWNNWCGCRHPEIDSLKLAFIQATESVLTKWLL